MTRSPLQVCYLVFAAFAVSCPALAGDLLVEVRNLRSARGQVLVAVCDAGQFLSPSCARVGRGEAAANGRILVRDVPPGIYAIQAFHDENSNGLLDRTLLGRPKEGMGFSRNAAMRFGPPAFSDAAVEIPPGGGNATLRMRYFQ